MYFYGCFQIDVLINPLRWAEVKIWKFYLENFVVQKRDSALPGWNFSYVMAMIKIMKNL